MKGRAMVSRQDHTGRRRFWHLPWRRRSVVLAAIGLFLGIQLIPVWISQTNPSPQAGPHWDTPRTYRLMQSSCLDCHSNSTVWPWYSRVAPVSWLVTLDVLQGRRALNFSTWATGAHSNEIGAEAIEAIRSGSMPPSQYLLLHRNAALSAQEKQQLIDGLGRSLR